MPVNKTGSEAPSLEMYIKSLSDSSWSAASDKHADTNSTSLSL